VLLGGMDDHSRYPNDIWEWDNATTQWALRPAVPPVQLKPSVPPVHRGG